MGKLRFLFALWMAKLSIPALKITRHNGTDFPGSLAVKLCPDFLKYIGKPAHIVAVTGTNGKTTVANMLGDVLTAEGKRVLSNRAGSNIVSGISTALLKGCDLLGRIRPGYDLAVLEVDERSAPKVYPYVKPEYIAVTNLFRDSIMRNAHPGYIADILTRSFPRESKLILNADDLISGSVAPENQRVYFGIDRLPTDVTACENLLNDMRICPKWCGEAAVRVPPLPPHRPGGVRELRLPLPGQRLSGHEGGHRRAYHVHTGGRQGVSLYADRRQSAQHLQSGDGHRHSAAAGL